MNKAQAIKHFGSVTALAKVLGLTYEAIRQWSEVPELRQYQLEQMTGGVLKAEPPRTLNANLRPSPSSDQSCEPAVIPSSAGSSQ